MDYGNTVKATLLVSVPVGSVTVMGPDVAPAGTVADTKVLRTGFDGKIYGTTRQNPLLLLVSPPN